MKLILFALTISTLLLLSGADVAQAETARQSGREARQQSRIDRGTDSGQINEAEARRLERNQNAIDRVETRTSADGQQTAAERARVERAQDRQSRAIRRTRHNGR